MLTVENDQSSREKAAAVKKTKQKQQQKHVTNSPCLVCYLCVCESHTHTHTQSKFDYWGAGVKHRKYLMTREKRPETTAADPGEWEN